MHCVLSALKNFACNPSTSDSKLAVQILKIEETLFERLLFICIDNKRINFHSDGLNTIELPSLLIAQEYLKR